MPHFRLALWLTVAVSTPLFTAACFNGVIDAPLACFRSVDCPTDLGCFDNRCVPVGPCLEDDGTTFKTIADGSPCPDGVCVAGVCGPPRCGDGVVSGDEGCDGEPECRADCTRCGDDVIDPGEACDDGSDNSDEGAGSCRSGCVLASCGDGVKDPGEGCDDGDGNSDADPNGCRLDCARASCGDGVVDDGEDCDDGDANSDILQNACRTTCVGASCGDGVTDDAEICDDGARNSDVQPDACRRACVPARCGDGTRDVGEGCDDGAGNSDVVANACRSTCGRARCGDDVVDSDEVCDGGPDCSLDCRKISDCGDGITDVGEDCDDGNGNDFDGCDRCRTSRWLGALQNRLTPDGPEPTRTTLSPRSVFVQPTTGRMMIASGCRLLQFPSSRAGEDPSLKAMVPIAGSPTCRTFEEPIAADGDVAASARFRSIASVVTDVQQNIYFIEDGVPLVRRIGLDGRLGTVRRMEGEHVSGMTADERGRVWWVEGSAIFQKGVDDVVTRVAGSVQTSGSGGDGGPALTALFGRPNALAVTPDGSLLVGDQFVNRLRIIRADGVVVAGPTFSSPVRAVAVTVDDRRLVFADNRIFELTDSLPRALFGNGSIDPIIEGGPALGGAVRVTSMTTDGDDIVIAELTYIRRLRPGSTPIIAGHLERFSPPEGGFPQDSLATGTPLSTGVHIGFDDEGRLLSVDEARSLMRVEADGTAFRREISTLLRPTLISSRAGRTVAADGAFSGCVFVNEDGSQTPAGCSVSEGPRALAQDRLGQVIFPDFFGQPPRTINRLNLDGSVTRIAGAGFGDPTIDGPAITSLFRAPFGFSMMPDDTLVFVEVGLGILHIDVDGIVRLLAANSEARQTAVTDDGTVYFATIERVFRVLPAGGGVEPVTAPFGDDALGLGQPATSVSMSPISGLASDGTRLCVANTTVRCFVPGGLVEGVLGPIDPPDLGPLPRSRLPGLGTMVRAAGDVVLGAVGDIGRVLRLRPAAGFVDVVIGVPDGVAGLAPRLQPLLGDAAALTIAGDRLFVADRLGQPVDPFDFDPPPRHGALLGFGLDAEGTPSSSLAIQTPLLTAPSGVAVVDDRTIAVSDSARHVVSLITIDDGSADVIVGIDGIAGRGVSDDLDGTRVLLSSPGSLLMAPGGDLYIADMDNNRVMRRSPDGRVRRILGDADAGSGIAAGAPSSQLPLGRPGQLALDRQGNLYVAAGRSLRVVYADDAGVIDGTGQSDVVFSAAVGDDVLGDLAEVTRCLSGVTVVDDLTLWVTDRCVGALIELRRP